MGIRFSCHGCAKPLNIKTELAGRRGVCPECRIKFRIPLSDAEFSTPLQDSRSATSTPLNEIQLAPQEQRLARQGSVGNEVANAGSDAAEGSGGGIATAPITAAPIATETKTEAAPTTRPEIAGTAQVAQSDPAPDAVDLLGVGASTTWYVRPPSGGQYGPANAEVLKAWIAEGRVAKTALLWRDGWPQWREASEALPELVDSLPGGTNNEADAPLFDGGGASKLTTPISLEKTSPVQSGFSGNAKIGSVRRKRTTQRITLVAVLATLVVGLIVTLVLVATTRG